MKLKEVGEFGLVHKIISLAGKLSDRVVVGLGDDAAVVYNLGEKLVATTDSLVEGVHFLPSKTSPQALGYKVLAVNLSDIAAMGATPYYSLLSLSLPAEIEENFLISLVNSFIEAGKNYGVELIGGDLHSSPLITITAVVLGGLKNEFPLLRSNARPGDLIATTGYLGASAGGLCILKGEFNLPSSEELIKAHFFPQPKLMEGKVLLECGVKAAIDISDGLVADLKKICLASGVGAIIKAKQVPISPALIPLIYQRALKLALFGGEDYELLFTAPQEVMENVVRKLPVFIIGKITTENVGQVEVVDEAGKSLLCEYGGWEHFKA